MMVTPLDEGLPRRLHEHDIRLSRSAKRSGSITLDSEAITYAICDGAAVTEMG